MVTAICGSLFDYRGSLGEGCVIVKNGFIADIRKDVNSDMKIYDFRGKNLIVTPAFIDLHVHLRGLKLSYKEDEFTGTKAALQSGILLVVDMPNTIPKLDNPFAIEEKLKALENKSVTDYGVYAALPRNVETLDEIIRKPIAGIKIYPEDLYYEKVLMYLNKLNDFRRIIIFHPELPEAEMPIVEYEESRSVHRGCHWEAASVSYLKRILNEKRLHITHTSCPSTVIEAKKLRCTVDTTPHYLFYKVREGCLWRVNPPLRDEETLFKLFNLFISTDFIDAVASDHAPHLLTEKVDPLSCRSGFPWLEAWPWFIFKLVSLGLLSLERFLKFLTKGPASILGIDNFYGSLEKGQRANILVIDPKVTWRFPGPKGSKNPHLHLFMSELKGKPKAAFLGGELVLLDEECYCSEANKVKVNAFS